MSTTLNVLSIAGSDPSGGAGIQADLRTFAALGAYGCTVVTALTAQNTIGVSSVFSVPASVIGAQLEAVASDVSIAAVKIGMLGSAAAVRAVVEHLWSHPYPFVVLDPVLRASTGATLLDEDAVRLVRDELLPLVTVVTPNAFEAGVFAQVATPTSLAAAHDAASHLRAYDARAVLVTGIQDGEDVVDVLHTSTGIFEHRATSADATTTHGTGCTLSSAITVLLARGYELNDACAHAQRFVADAITHGSELAVGHGAGPVHQLAAMWTCGPGGEVRRA